MKSRAVHPLIFALAFGVMVMGGAASGCGDNTGRAIGDLPYEEEESTGGQSFLPPPAFGGRGGAGGASSD